MLKLFCLLSCAAIIVAQLPKPDDRCPAVNNGRALNLPHDSDCSLYYKCHFGLKFLMPACPRGMLFDAISSQCVAESIARCEIFETSTSIDTSTPPTAPTAGTSTKITSEPSTFPTVPSEKCLN